VIYLACPYTGCEEASFNTMLKVLARYLEDGVNAYSPIVHYHHVAPYVKDIDWLDFDLQVLQLCSELHIIALPGWEKSKGVKVEIIAAGHIGLKIKLVEVE